MRGGRPAPAEARVAGHHRTDRHGTAGRCPTPRALRELETLTAGLVLLSVDTAVHYHDAAAIHRAARSAERTVRRTNDCLIAAVAARTGATLVHRDADFDIIAETIAVKTRRLV